MKDNTFISDLSNNLNDFVTGKTNERRHEISTNMVCAILSTFITLPFVIKICVLSICEWPFFTGFTVVPLYEF